MAVTKDGKPKRAADYEAEEKKARVNKALAIRAKLDPGPEGDVARDMLAKRKTDDVVVVDMSTHDTVAERIREEFGKGIEAQFAIGRLLNEAAAFLASDQYPANGEFGRRGDEAYSRWVAAQGFPFKRGTAHLLRTGQQREDEVRALIAGRVQENERDIGVPYAVQLLTAPPTPPTQTPIAKQARKDLKEALHSEDDIPEVVAWLSATDTLIAFTDAVPVAELKAIGEKAQALIAWFNQQKEQRA
jgi:hypothetical protein